MADRDLICEYPPPPRRSREAIEGSIRQRRANLAIIEALDEGAPGRYRADLEREHAYLNYLLSEWEAAKY